MNALEIVPSVIISWVIGCIRLEILHPQTKKPDILADARLE
jgi:hypothetical protein